MSDDELNFSPAFSFGARRHEPAADRGDGDGAPEVAPERRFDAKALTLLPAFGPGAAKPDPEPTMGRSFAWKAWNGPLAGGALAICLALGGAAVVAIHRDAAPAAQMADSTAETLKKLTSRLDALEAKLRPDDVGEKKLATDVKATLAATRDLNGALAQLGARVDKLDQAQSARIEKLSERFDKEVVRSLSEVTLRPEKHASLDVTPAQPAANALPAPRLVPPLAVAKPDLPGVSNEPTGSIERPRPTLAGYSVLDVRDGIALIQTRDGPQEVSPGDYLPGIGRVERIEKRGRQWAVVTSLGAILGE